MSEEIINDVNWEFPVGHCIWGKILESVIRIALMYRTKSTRKKRWSQMNWKFRGQQSEVRGDRVTITASIWSMPGNQLQEITDQQSRVSLSQFQSREYCRVEWALTAELHHSSIYFFSPPLFWRTALQLPPRLFNKFSEVLLFMKTSASHPHPPPFPLPFFQSTIALFLLTRKWGWSKESQKRMSRGGIDGKPRSENETKCSELQAEAAARNWARARGRN